MKRVSVGPERFLSNGKNGGNGRNGFGEAPTKGEIEAAIQRYIDLFEFAPIGYVSFSRVGRIEEINLAAAALLGGTRSRWVGSPFAMCVMRDDTQIFLHHLLRCRSSEARVETELRLKSSGSEVLHVLLSSTPMTSSVHDGAFLYQTAIIDLTEHKRAEDELRRSERRYRTLFDLVPVAVYTCDAKGLILEFNQRAVELWGREPKTNDPHGKILRLFQDILSRRPAHAAQGLSDGPRAARRKGAGVRPRNFGGARRWHPSQCGGESNGAEE